MAFTPVPYSVFGTAAVDAINAALAAIDGARVALSSHVDAALEAEADARNDVDLALNGVSDFANNGLKAEAQAREAVADAADQAVSAARGAASSAQDAASSAGDAASAVRSIAAEVDAELAAFADRIAAQAVSLFLAARPGDMPAAFTSDLASGISGVPPNAAPALGPAGTVLRIVGAAVVAPVGLRAVEVNRLYKMRAVVRRQMDTTDPAGDAVRFGVAWYGADRNLLAALPQSLFVEVALAVADGRQMWPALASATPGAFLDGLNAPLPAVVTAPVGACYMRPFVQTFGGGVTDVEVLECADVSDANLINITSDALAARLARVEAALGITAASA